MIHFYYIKERRINNGDKIIISEIGKSLYIRDLHSLVNNDKYVLIPRDKNKDFINRFKLDNKDIKKMLLSLSKENILYQVEDRDYLKYGSEPLIVFEKKYKLIDMYGRDHVVSVYIKIKFKDNILPIISFHLDE